MFIWITWGGISVWPLGRWDRRWGRGIICTLAIFSLKVETYTCKSYLDNEQIWEYYFLLPCNFFLYPAMHSYYLKVFLDLMCTNHLVSANIHCSRSETCSKFTCYAFITINLYIFVSNIKRSKKQMLDQPI